MFEELEQEERGEKEERNKLLRMTAYIVGVLAIVGVIVYIGSRGHAKTSRAVQTLSAATQTAPDPVKDLKIINATMRKDPSGIRVMWLVQLRNKSAVYTYSDVQYEASFIGPDGRTIIREPGHNQNQHCTRRREEITPVHGRGLRRKCLNLPVRACGRHVCGAVG